MPRPPLHLEHVFSLFSSVVDHQTSNTLSGGTPSKWHVAAAPLRQVVAFRDDVAFFPSGSSSPSSCSVQPQPRPPCRCGSPSTSHFDRPPPVAPGGNLPLVPHALLRRTVRPGSFPRARLFCGSTGTSRNAQRRRSLHQFKTTRRRRPKTHPPFLVPTAAADFVGYPHTRRPNQHAPRNFPPHAPRGPVGPLSTARRDTIARNMLPAREPSRAPPPQHAPPTSVALPRLDPRERAPPPPHPTPRSFYQCFRTLRAPTARPQTSPSQLHDHARHQSPPGSGPAPRSHSHRVFLSLPGAAAPVGVCVPVFSRAPASRLFARSRLRRTPAGEKHRSNSPETRPKHRRHPGLLVRGGMGQVLPRAQKSLPRDLAAKTLRERTSTSPRARTQFPPWPEGTSHGRARAPEHPIPLHHFRLRRPAACPVIVNEAASRACSWPVTPRRDDHPAGWDHRRRKKKTSAEPLRGAPRILKNVRVHGLFNFAAQPAACAPGP